MLYKECNFLKLKIVLIYSSIFLCLFLISFSALAQDSKENFSIESADTYRSADNYYLNATINYDLHAEAHDILAKGLPIHILFDLEMYKFRRYWLDKTLLKKQYVYIIQLDPITDRYELTRTDTNFTLSYETADKAIESLRYLSNLFITEVNKVPVQNGVFAQLQMSLDVRNFPEPMQYLSQYWGDWVRTTNWYRWSLEEEKILEPDAVLNKDDDNVDESLEKTRSDINNDQDNNLESDQSE